MAKTREEIVETAMGDWNAKHASDENWLRSRIQGAWNSGYHNAQQQMAETLKAVEREWYDKGFEDGRKEVEKQPFITCGEEVIADYGEVKFIATHIGDYDVCGIDEEGNTYAYMFDEIVGKTGKCYSVHVMPVPQPQDHIGDATEMVSCPKCINCQCDCQMIGCDMRACASYEPPKDGEK